jgi:hypothetical protein
MLRLICINNLTVFHANNTNSTGDGLLEGEIYTARDEILVHPNNKNDCYYILELKDLKLVSRFIRLSELNADELTNSAADVDTHEMTASLSELNCS